MLNLSAVDENKDIATKEYVDSADAIRQPYIHWFKRDTNTDKYVKININEYGSQMWSFIVRLYGSYRAFDVLITGYNYGTNHWYTPTATLLGSSDNTSITVYFGYDSDWHLWIAFPSLMYQGVSICNILATYVEPTAKYEDLFTITEVSSIPTTLQTTKTAYAPWRRNETVSVGSASGWSAGTLPTKGTNIAADDITAWTTNTPTAVTPNTVVTGGTKTSIPNISKKTVVTGVTKKTVVTGGSTTSITPVTKKTVVTGVTKKTVVTGGSTTNITPVTKKTVVTSASGATATISNGLLTITNGSFSTGDSVTEGTAVAAYTSLTTGDSVTVTTGDSVTTGTAVDVYTSLTTGDSVTVTTGDSVTVGTAIEAYTSLDTGPACSVTAGTAASLSYTARSIPNITAVGTLPSLTITNKNVAGV